jgi:hypothetical protein
VRSFPFIILLVALVPFTRALTGTSIGPVAAAVPLSFAAIPYFARLVEQNLREVPRGVIEAAQAMGASDLQIVTRVLLLEARSGLTLAPDGARNQLPVVFGGGRCGGRRRHRRSGDPLWLLPLPDRRDGAHRSAPRRAGAVDPVGPATPSRAASTSLILQFKSGEIFMSHEVFKVIAASFASPLHQPSSQRSRSGRAHAQAKKEIVIGATAGPVRRPDQALASSRSSRRRAITSRSSSSTTTCSRTSRWPRAISTPTCFSTSST